MLRASRPFALRVCGEDSPLARIDRGEGNVLGHDCESIDLQLHFEAEKPAKVVRDLHN